MAQQFSLSQWERVRVRAAGYHRAIGLPSPRPSPTGRGGKERNTDWFWTCPSANALEGGGFGKSAAHTQKGLLRAR
jgi:hypothetical protein